MHLSKLQQKLFHTVEKKNLLLRQRSCSSTLSPVSPTARDDSLIYVACFLGSFLPEIEISVQTGASALRSERVSQTRLEQSGGHVLWGRCGCFGEGRVIRESARPVGAYD